MKNYSLKWMILTITLILCSTSCSKIHQPSPFLTNFSLRKTIERMKLEEIDINSLSTSSTSSAGDPSSHRQEQDLDIAINDSNVESFDERGFLFKLQQQIDQEIRNSGLTVMGGGRGGDTFDIAYQNEQFRGGVDLIGIRTAKNKYRVWCVVRELASANPRT